MPLRENRVPEFAGVGDITMNIACNWIDAMFRGVMESDYDAIFQTLAEKWRWNLYIREPRSLKRDSIRGGAQAIAERCYEGFVRKRFRGTYGQSRPPRVIAPSPRLWRLRDLKSRQLGQAAAA